LAILRLGQGNDEGDERKWSRGRRGEEEEEEE
jgi:hypothetical protein